MSEPIGHSQASPGSPLNSAQVEAEPLLATPEYETAPGLMSASAATMLSSVTGFGAAIVRSKLIAVLLGPSGIGVLSNLGIYNSLAIQVGAAFTGQGATRAIAIERTAGRSARVDWLIRYCLIASVAVGAAIAVVTVLIAPQLSGVIMGSAEYAPLVALSALPIPVLLLGYSYAQILQGFRQIGTLAKSSIATTTIAVGLVFVLVVPFGLTGAVIATGAVGVAQLGIFLLLAPWVVLHRKWRRGLEPSWKRIRPIVGLGLASVVLGTTSTLVSLIIRTAIVAQLGIEQVGVYQPVSAVSDTYLEVLISATGLYLLPRLTELLASGQRDNAADEIGRCMRLTLAVTVPCILLAIAFGDQLVTLLYSSRFHGASAPLAIQMAGSVVKVIAWGVSAALIPMGKYRTWLMVGLSTVIVKLLATMALLPILHLEGVALAYDLSWIWSAGVTIVSVSYFGGLRIPREYWAFAAMAVGIVALAFASQFAMPPIGAVVGLGSTIAVVIHVRRDLRELMMEFVGMASRRMPRRYRGR